MILEVPSNHSHSVWFCSPPRQPPAVLTAPCLPPAAPPTAGPAAPIPGGASPALCSTCCKKSPSQHHVMVPTPQAQPYPNTLSTPSPPQAAPLPPHSPTPTSHVHPAPPHASPVPVAPPAAPAAAPGAVGSPHPTFVLSPFGSPRRPGGRSVVPSDPTPLDDDGRRRPEPLQGPGLPRSSLSRSSGRRSPSALYAEALGENRRCIPGARTPPGRPPRPVTWLRGSRNAQCPQRGSAGGLR